MNRLREKYIKEAIPALMKHFEYKNVHQVPKLEKISINMGVGAATQNKAILDNAVKELTLIAGRKPIITKAKKSISNFKLRTGMPIGCKVTLRGEIMYEFLDRLISIVIPRIRDLRRKTASSESGHAF
ncbi:MAG: 50S ribosomal protein L5 [Candidatus Cloacimonas sp. 4484_275]|nr:MAG: 50S ribosomal protein L5 [Candidatus Cloacimonas sp. 4484_275]